MRINTWEEAKKVLDEHPETYKQALNNQIIHELEKIKAEFENKEGVFTSYHFVKAIDEHIAKLKGE